jgi:CRISPR/Cas system-associated exonuclease Cas4 (RecB family)
MVYSFTQISQYLRCPRSYRYRYLDGWREKETRAAMTFGRCFENALGAFFRGEDSGAALFSEWGGGLKGSMQHRVAVYPPGFEIPRFVAAGY